VKRILVIEPDKKVSDFIRRGLEDEGFHVDRKFGADEGFKYASSNSYSLIIMELFLPAKRKDKSVELGLQFIKELKESPITSGVPILVVSSQDTIENIVTGLNIGAQDYLTKPFAFAEFLARVKRLLMLTENSVERYIEFPAELYQAGLGILNYFGSYLKQCYPGEKAKVKVEQHEGIIKLVVETLDGRTEVIEKALYEYGTLISGQNVHTNTILNETFILELKNELRIAKLRIEYQQDIMLLQNHRIQDLECKSNKLMDILGSGLSFNPSISIDFKPNISTLIQHDDNVTKIIENIINLRRIMSEDGEVTSALSDAENSLRTLEGEKDPDVVMKSNGLKVLKDTLIKIMKSGNDINNTLSGMGKNIDLVKDVAKNYNKIALWCGLPELPVDF